MNQRELKQQATIRKKVNCSLTDCGQYFTFEISEQSLSQSDQNKRIYVGKCRKCYKDVKLKASQRNSFSAIYGQANYVVTTSTFTDIFEQVGK
jgi:hypothetical protein